MYRIGQGIDFHKLVEGREFWLGGILIPHTKGALGHSDADVLLHAICDALLGALALGDIGKHFPDTDAAYKGIDSKVLLKKTYELVAAKGYVLVNVDSTILLQAPKIMKYVPEMRSTIAGILHISPDDVSIKATTTEQLSFIGREEGIVATANIMLRKVSDAKKLNSMIDIALSAEPLSTQACIDKVMSPESGGIDVFIGTVRNATKGRKVLWLEFEAYEPMALKELNKIACEAMNKWPVHKLVIHHRTGKLDVGEIPVIIAVSAAHRDAAFDACRYIIDTLKQTVPIWKKEVFEDGEIWVAAHP